MKKFLVILFILGFLTSCGDEENYNNEISVVDVDTTHASAIIERYQQHMKSTISEPFKIYDLKNLNFTSGIAENSNENEYCNRLNNGFLATYYLIDENFVDENGRPIGGTITVHSTGKANNWHLDDTTQTIWKIHVKSNVISLWDSIHVGQSRKEVERFGTAKNGFCIKKGDYYYSCDFNNYSMVCVFKDDTLRELTVTRNCN